MLLPIRRYGDTILHKPAQPVGEITAEIRDLARDMAETMYAAPGVGLAATQIGIAVRLFVIDVSGGREADGLITLVNPEFLERDGMQLEEEGCLSLPGFNAIVARPQRARVKGLDLSGREVVIEGSGLLARALQHEMDHLDGRVFVEHLRGIKRDLILRKIRKQIRGGTW